MRPSVRKPAGASALVLACLVAVAPAAAYEIVSARTTPPRLLLYGAREAYGITQSGMGLGDLNGDGQVDVVVGSYLFDANGVRNSGEAAVVFGPFAEPAVRDLALLPPDLVITGRTDMEVGASIMIEDVDADGIADMVIGAPVSQERPAPGRLRGEIGILFGPLAAGNVDFRVHEADLWIHGGADNDQIGWDMALGDMDGDGAKDLIIGIAGWRGGRIDVVFGPLTPGPTRDLATRPAEASILGDLDAEAFGSALAVGDVSGDGVPDICGSAPQYGFVDPEGLGEVRCVFGPFSRGRVTDLRITPPDVRIRGRCERDELAARLAIADFDGDGNGDLAMSSPSACRASSGDDAGVLLVERGPLLPGTIIDQVVVQPDVVLKGASGSLLGTELATAPLVGRSMLVVSAITSSRYCGVGAVHVLNRLPPDGTIMDMDAVSDRVVFSEARAPIGYELAAIDVDGDGLPEIAAVGVSDGPDGSRPGCGRLILYREGDRCEERPPPIEEPIHLTRSGDDVLVHFVPSGLEEDGIGVDLIRGLFSELNTRRPETLLGACNLRSPPGTDGGAAARDRPAYYYLAARGCQMSCHEARLIGSLGSGDAGPRPGPEPDPWVPGCP